MRIQIAIFATVLLAGCIAGCSRDNAPADSSAGDSKPAPAESAALSPAAAAMGAPVDAQASPDASVVVPATGVGIIKAIDAAAGRVTIEHGPIDALHWPAMSMAFNASPTMLGSLQEGDKVRFEFTQQGKTSTITRIEPGN